MNELQLLLIELNELTSTLLYFIDQQETERALELVERRLLIVDSIKGLFDTYPELRLDIQKSASELLLVDR
jgi:hypothetical protein